MKYELPSFTVAGSLPEENYRRTFGWVREARKALAKHDNNAELALLEVIASGATEEEARAAIVMLTE